MAHPSQTNHSILVVLSIIDACAIYINRYQLQVPCHGSMCQYTTTCTFWMWYVNTASIMNIILTMFWTYIREIIKKVSLWYHRQIKSSQTMISYIRPSSIKNWSGGLCCIKQALLHYPIRLSNSFCPFRFHGGHSMTYVGLFVRFLAKTNLAHSPWQLHDKPVLAKYIL